MNFKTNEVSAQLLIDLGFKETTEKVFPKFSARIQVKGYDASNMKREFDFNRKDYITFNYISIQGWGRFSFIGGVQPNADDIRLFLLLIKLYPKNRRETIDTLKNRIRRVRFHKRYRPLRLFDEAFWCRYLEADREIHDLLIEYGFDINAMRFEPLQEE